ncbi:hypothetical protein PAHAL_3G427600 [Panicum hallii]|uniref:Uncharacterized protein n=1 Tax=Panicum hallii TaxID=206008 RepID=A0A2T8KL40_9POAL|nr:hypothetical protein PAHAL_3G427600 [Panicum hallii]
MNKCVKFSEVPKLQQTQLYTIIRRQFHATPGENVSRTELFYSGRLISKANGMQGVPSSGLSTVCKL